MRSNPLAIVFRIWYRYVNSRDKQAEVIFMNYGFSDDEKEVQLDEENEINRYSIQLYDHLAEQVEIKGKDIVEIGSGRGGGLSYITGRYAPKSAKGVEIDKTAVSFCQSHHKHENLSFVQGDAQKLSLEDNSVDVIINVESSHRYPEFDSFLSEVNRILRPGGYFLFTDFRYDHKMESMMEKITASGLKITKTRNINKEVIKALDLDHERRSSLVKKLTPKMVHKVGHGFAGAIGSPTYNKLSSGEFVYFSYVLQN